MNFTTILLLIGSLLVQTAQAQHCNNSIQKTKPDDQYTISQDGTEVTDTKTGLIWQRCALGMSWNGSTCEGAATNHTWENALAQAATVASSTGVTWRLPNIKELKSLVETACVDQAINESLFPATPTTLWSSSAVASDTYFAWFVIFYDGYDLWGINNDSLAVRLVRSQ